MSGVFEDEPDSLVGRILNEKYELISCLGSGSMGAVLPSKTPHSKEVRRGQSSSFRY